ncbi:MAG TPA: WYL domain-containing transcriptional regulator [Clostridia bacterium]|jgi:predicted DNA-binding transcriptional regulator YafY|nr:WYL domain-containing transcriptional regulator [Clostridia bacterium]HQC68325.1 WYL domain-containing transcriptional regulator [Clostridia bacterium]
MAKSAVQKAKLLHIYKMLYENTDENHVMTVNDIIRQLASVGINAERKSIYDDIKVLNELGCDIIGVKSKTYGYYMASREFQIPELKLIIDALVAARFLTEKKTKELIDGLCNLASQHQKKELVRNTGVYSKAKSKNENVYYNIDSINEAISKNAKIRFSYFDYDIDKNKVYRGVKGKYKVSPYALIWEDECYYLVCYYERYNVTQFKVDKMESIEILKEKIDMDKKEEFDLVTYTKPMFNMFKGEPVKAEIIFDMSLLNVVFDRFGLDITVYPVGKNKFKAFLNVSISPTFIAWLFTFGDKAQLVAPQNLVDEIKSTLNSLNKTYGC